MRCIIMWEGWKLSKKSWNWPDIDGGDRMKGVWREYNTTCTQVEPENINSSQLKCEIEIVGCWSWNRILRETKWSFVEEKK